MGVAFLRQGKRWLTSLESIFIITRLIINLNQLSAGFNGQVYFVCGKFEFGLVAPWGFHQQIIGGSNEYSAHRDHRFDGVPFD